MKGKLTVITAIVMILGSILTSNVKAELRLPWNYNESRAAYRIDTADVADGQGNQYSGACSTHDLPNHAGKIDFGLGSGENVRVSETGVIDRANRDCDSSSCPSWGKYVVVRHSEDSYTLYAHMSRVDVDKADNVNQGVKIGEVGSTGNSSGPHIHFEWWTCGNYGCRANPSFFEGKSQEFPNPAGRLVCGSYTSRNGQDNDPPNLTVHSPTPASQQGRKFRFKITAEDIGVAAMDRIELKVIDLLSGVDYSQYLPFRKKNYNQPKQSVTIDNAFNAPNGLIEPTTFKLEVKAFDRFGNKKVKSVTFGFDGEDPVLELSSFPEGYNASGEIFYQWSSTDNLTESNNIKHWYELEGPVSVRSDYFYDSGMHYNSGLPEGVYTSRFYAEDAYGNRAVKTTAFTVDSTAPDNPDLAVNNCSDYSGDWQNTCNLPEFSWQKPEDMSGVAGYYLYFGQEPDGMSEEIVNVSKYTVEKELSSGKYFLRVKTFDNAGNINLAWKTIAVLLYDNRAPDVELALDNGGRVTFDSTVLADLNSYDQHSGNDKFRYKLNNGNWTEWIKYKRYFELKIRYVYGWQQVVTVQVRDKLGNTSLPVDQTITVTEGLAETASENYTATGQLTVTQSTPQNSYSYSVTGDMLMFSPTDGVGEAPVSVSFREAANRLTGTVDKVDYELTYGDIEAGNSSGSHIFRFNWVDRQDMMAPGFQLQPKWDKNGSNEIFLQIEANFVSGTDSSSSENFELNGHIDYHSSSL